jgi:hypothetical protein
MANKTIELTDDNKMANTPEHIEVTNIYYKGWDIRYNSKPIPTNIYDYDVLHEDYDGSSDSNDNRFFTTESIESAKLLIDEWIEE